MPRPQPLYLVVALALVQTLFSPIIARAATPADPRYGEQWGLATIAAPVAWDVTTGSPEVVIAVVDSGVDITHPDLTGQIWTNPGEIAGNGQDDDGNGFVDDIHGWNLLANSADLSDSTGHGTQVAGVIAAKANNGAGGAGVCWGCRLMVVKVTQQSGAANYSDIAAGVRYAAQKGAQVINISLGGASDSAALRAAVAEAAPNAVIVAGAGNSGGEAPFYPAAYDEQVLAVAGSAENDTRVAGSNYGAWVDASAPGQNVLTTFSGGGYGLASGTSVGAPFASGLAGLLLSAHPDWSPAQVRAQIIRTADSIDALNPSYAGKLGGRIDAGAALTVAARPDLRISELRVNGVLNGRPEPGTTVELQVLLRNTWAAASTVQATLNGGAPATINQAGVSFGAVPSLSTASGESVLRFTVPSSAGYNKALAFTLRVTAAGSYSASLPLTITTAPGITTAPATISGNVIWTSDRLYVVNGNTGITEGSTLTIQPGATVRFAPNANLSVYGTLRADGTPERPITFTGTPGAKPWGVIRFDSPSSNATYDVSGAYLSGSLLRHTIIEDGQGVLLQGGHPYIADSLFRRLHKDVMAAPETGGLVGALSGKLVIERNRFEGTFINLYPMPAGNITVRENQVVDGSINVGQAGEHTFLIEGNSVSNANDAKLLGIAAGGHGQVIQNRVVGGITGIAVSNQGSTLLISDNLVSQVAQEGISIGASTSQDSPPAVMVDSNTVIQAGKSALSVQRLSDGASIEIHGNNLIPLTDAYALTLGDQFATPLNATGNWWGSTDAALINKAIYDGADEFGLGMVNSGSALNVPSLTAPAYVERVTVSPDDTLGIQTGTFDLRFSRSMDVSTIPSVAFTDTRNGTAQRFDYPTMTGITTPAIDSGGIAWISTPTGLASFDGKTWITHPFPAGMVTKPIYGVAVDSHDHIWLAGNGGALYYDRRQYTAFPMCPSPGATGCEQTYNFMQVVPGPDGAIWFGAPYFSAAPIVARLKDGQWTVYPSADSSLSYQSMSMLQVQSDGSVWVALTSSSTSTSPNVARLMNGSWTRFSLKPFGTSAWQPAAGLANDVDGSLWTRVGSALFRFDGSTWREVVNEPRLGMYVSSQLQIDHHGVKWFYMSQPERLLLRFDGVTWSERSYGTNSSTITHMTIDKQGNKWAVDFQPNNFLALATLYDSEELPLRQGTWIDARTYRVRHDFTTETPRGPKALSVRGAVDTDGLMLSLNAVGRFTIDYAAQISDRTPPQAPMLFPTGVIGDPAALRLSWTANDPDSGITAVRYQVGTRPGLGDLVGPTTVSVAASGQAQLAEAELQATSGATIQRSIPGLAVGRTYYVSLDVRNSGGLWSPATVRPFTAGVQTFYQLYLPSLRR